MFSDPPYRRGAMTLQALRETIGEQDFFALLKTWFAENRYGNVTTADFIATAERVSGEELSAFFDAWLYGTTRPPLPGELSGGEGNRTPNSGMQGRRVPVSTTPPVRQQA